MGLLVNRALYPSLRHRRALAAAADTDMFISRPSVVYCFPANVLWYFTYSGISVYLPYVPFR